MEMEILEILREARPESDFENSKNFIEDGMLDSFDMVMLIDELEERFGVSIDGEEILPNNFISVVAIAHLVSQSKKIQ